MTTNNKMEDKFYKDKKTMFDEVGYNKPYYFSRDIVDDKGFKEFFWSDDMEDLNELLSVDNNIYEIKTLDYNSTHNIKPYVELLTNDDYFNKNIIFYILTYLSLSTNKQVILPILKSNFTINNINDSDINFMDIAGGTPLAWSALLGMHESVIDLINRGANPNIKVFGIDTYGSVFKKYLETGEFDKNEIYPYITEGIGEDFLPANVDFSLIDKFEKAAQEYQVKHIGLAGGVAVGIGGGQRVVVDVVGPCVGGALKVARHHAHHAGAGVDREQCGVCAAQGVGERANGAAHAGGGRGVGGVL
jgi:hypothetical protein